MSVQTSTFSATSSKPKIIQMYSAAGASFQEWALKLLDQRGSLAHQSIGRFVTAINNGRMTLGQAEAAYMALLYR